MQAGYWFNPRTGAWALVTRHDEWIRDERNALSVGVSQTDAAWLRQIDDVDEIRRATMVLGLVRVRDYGKYISVQFSASRNLVSSILSEVAAGLKHLKFDQYSPLQITNFATFDSVVVQGGLVELVRKLDAGESVLREAEIRRIADSIDE